MHAAAWRRAVAADISACELQWPMRITPPTSPSRTRARNDGDGGAASAPTIVAPARRLSGEAGAAAAGVAPVTGAAATARRHAQRSRTTG